MTNEKSTLVLELTNDHLKSEDDGVTERQTAALEAIAKNIAIVADTIYHIEEARICREEKQRPPKELREWMSALSSLYRTLGGA